MKRITFIICLIVTQLANAQTTKQNDVHFNKCIKKWFSAWELVSKDVYKINTLKPTDFLLFDDKYLYTTSIISGKDGQIIKGPNLLGQKNVWRKKAHNGKIMLPTGQEQDVKIMCFTGSDEKDKNSKNFFVMPLITYWIQKKIDDHGIGHDNLVTAVFVHEFSHSQQIDSTMNDVQETLDNYFRAHEKEQFYDDIIQDIYEKDTLYTTEFKKELALFFDAANAKTNSERIQLAKQAMKMLEERQIKMLEKDNRDLTEIDNYWLTVEGTGQYSFFAWLIHPKGGKLPVEVALKASRSSSWSQEEGLAIFYLYSKFYPAENWGKKMFRSKKINMIELLKKELN